MKRFAEIARRIPRWALFAVAALVQIALVALMIGGRVAILRDGAEVTLQTKPVDLYGLYGAFLRGDDVELSYTISTLPAGALKGVPSAGRNTPVFVKLAPNTEGFYEAVSVHAAPIAVTPPERLIRGRVVRGVTCANRDFQQYNFFCEELDIKYGIEKYGIDIYFAHKITRLLIEQARNKGKVSIVAAVTPDGRAAIKRLLIDGKPVYDEPLF